ncbi:unnamed protein product [Orchesella dallaii]|uniref:Peptidase M14 domain-containing protein n=1 Tax=Orchesella dallaii TaxID=48710 RepID=A0ABP1PM72_9HEXA
MKYHVVTLLLISITSTWSEDDSVGMRRYERHKIFSVTADTSEKLKFLEQLQAHPFPDGSLVDFWSLPGLDKETDIMVAPTNEQAFKELMDENGISFEVKVDDVQTLIEDGSKGNIRARSRQGTEARRMGWGYYARYSEIEHFLTGLVSTDEITVSVETIGTSYEGRNIRAVKLSTSPKNTKSVLIDANIHAREWITSATATWIINELLTETPYYNEMLKGIDWYIVPLLNPDGYEYSHTDDRLWRKTRSDNPGSKCKGTDPNRNFPFHFGSRSSDKNPCSPVYQGSAALSQNEAQAISNLMKRLLSEGSLLCYISFHAYGQYWLYPWGYQTGLRTDDYEEQASLGKKVVAAIKDVHGTVYTTGTAADALYPVGGCSDDYAKSIGVKYTVTIEMRDRGTSAFILPPSEIVPNAEEVLAALKVVAARVRNDPNVEGSPAKSQISSKSPSSSSLYMTMTYSQAVEVGIRRYDGHQVLSVIPDTAEKLGVLRQIYNNNEGSYDFWTEPALNRKVDIMVTPELLGAFKQLLEKNGMSYKVKVADVQT